MNGTPSFPWVRGVAGGVRVVVWAVPGARRTEVVGPHGDAIRIRVAARPEAGKANRALARFLRDVTGATAVTLEHGAGSRRKTYLLEGVGVERVVVCLAG